MKYYIKNDNKYIGYVIKGKKVIFKANNTVHIKNKIYAISESVNIIYNNLNKNYVIIDSNNQPYFNKVILILNFIGIFVSMICFAIAMIKYNNLLGLSIISIIVSFSLLMFQLFYVVLGQPKRLYKNYTQTIEAEIIDYSRTEYRHDRKETFHCDYNIMYKYKTPNGHIIHSVVNSHQAKLLYKDYPLNKKILIKYNPLKCCESCLVDEYNSIFYNTKFVKRNSFVVLAIGKIINITTKCIDDEVEDYLKEHCLVDYIECEYKVSNIIYKTNSIFTVPHGRFKIGEKIRIFYEYDDKTKFFCDINKKYGTSDKY